jgi:hypothetical protein
VVRAVTGLHPRSAAISVWVRSPSAQASTILHRNVSACDELCRCAPAPQVLAFIAWSANGSDQTHLQPAAKQSADPWHDHPGHDWDGDGGGDAESGDEDEAFE